MSRKHHHSETEHPGSEDQLEQNETVDPQEPVPAEEVQAESIPSEIDTLKKEVDDLKEKLIYLQADYQNYRKRVAKDVSDARVYGTANALSPFLTVFDYLNMAKTASEKSDKAFDELNVKKLDSVGAKFNPELHEAVAREASDTIPEGQILKEWSGGFKMGDKLLRAARVVVSSGPAAEAETAEAKKEE